MGLENAYTMYLIEASKLHSKIQKSGKGKKDESNDSCVPLPTTVGRR